MPLSRLDHIVITASSLADGVDYVREALGVAMQPGGEHARMGTHNCFLKLGERVYLEVISINPAASAPDRPRWFALDHVQPGEAPRLASWLARTDDIRAAVAASPEPLGEVEPMSRGNLNWLITIPRDGSFPLQGIAPTLIEWPAGVHPTNTLEDKGCRLVSLQGFHPQPEKVRGVLRAIGLDDEAISVEVGSGTRASLIAHIRTPAGMRQIG